MTLATIRRRATLGGVIVLLLAISAPVANPPGAAGAPWERRVDPFLRRLALGTRRRQGPFTDEVPGKSSQAARALPGFVLAERSGVPSVHVKAGLVDGASPAGRGNASLRRALSDLGVETRGEMGSVLSLVVPAASIESLAGRPEIAWLKAAHSYQLMNEISTAAAQVASDQANTAFDRGAGVIVAIVDTGIEWTDHDFRKADGTTRLLGIWDQTLTDAAHPPPSGFSFGAYYSA